jgi:hypothetical protein
MCIGKFSSAKQPHMLHMQCWNESHGKQLSTTREFTSCRCNVSDSNSYLPQWSFACMSQLLQKSFQSYRIDEDIIKNANLQVS